MDAPNKRFALAGSLEELKAKGRLVMHGSRRPILVIYDQGRVLALDNRCPHMGFPLERGSIEDGILTCHWHHARFDLESGCTFDLWADDVPICPVEVRNGAVWVETTFGHADPAAHWHQRLADDLAHDIGLVIAKAVHGQLATDVPLAEIVRQVALFGAQNSRRAFPVSSATVRASSSIRGSSASATRARSRPRSRGIVRDQAGNASAAAFTARATSSTRPRGISATGRRCAGSSTSSTSPDALSTHFPPINMGTFLSAAASLRVCLTAVMIASSLFIATSVPRSAMLRLRMGESNRGRKSSSQCLEPADGTSGRGPLDPRIGIVGLAVWRQNGVSCRSQILLNCWSRGRKLDVASGRSMELTEPTSQPKKC